MQERVWFEECSQRNTHDHRRGQKKAKAGDESSDDDDAKEAAKKKREQKRSGAQRGITAVSHLIPVGCLIRIEMCVCLRMESFELSLMLQLHKPFAYHHHRPPCTATWAVDRERHHGPWHEPWG